MLNPDVTKPPSAPPAPADLPRATMTVDSSPDTLSVARWVSLPLALGVLALALPIMNSTYAVSDWLFWRIAWLWFWTALHSAGCVSAGFVLLTKALGKTELPTLETAVMSHALGLVAFTIVMYAGGALGMYEPWFAVLLPLCMIAVGGVSFLRFLRERRRASIGEPPSPAGFWVKLSWAAGALCLFFVYMEALTPDAINFDANWYHLPTAQDYAREGRLVPFYSQYNRALPHLATFLFTWGWLLPGLTASLRWMMALHLEFACFVWTLAGVAAAARWMLGETRHRGTWAAFFLFPIIFVYDSNLGGSADHVLATFAAPALLASARALHRFEWRSCVLAGAMLGGALLTKYQAVYIIGGLGVVLLCGFVVATFRLLSRDMAGRRAAEAKRLVLGGAALVGSLVGVSSPHFIKNLIFYNNPFYPFLQRALKSSYPTTPKSALFFHYIYADGGGFEHREPIYERLLAAMRHGLTAPFEPHYSFTRDVPALGAMFVLLIPFALFVRDRRRIWLTIAAAYVGAVVWAWTYLADRYLQALVPLFAAVTASILVRAWDLSWVGRLALVPLVLLQIVWSGDVFFYNGGPRLYSAMTLIDSGLSGRIESRSKYRSDFVRLGESLPRDAVAIYHMERMNLGIDRKLLFDGPRTQAYIYYDKIKGPRALYDYYKTLGVTHLIWSSSAAPDHSKQAEVLFNYFVFNYAERRKKFGYLNVAAMPKTRPPPDSEFLVLSVGTGYADGLYPLEALTKQELLPPRRRGRYPKPLETFSNSEEAARVLERARAVAFAPASPGAKYFTGMLRPTFVRGIHYDAHDVFVRKLGPR